MTRINRTFLVIALGGVALLLDASTATAQLTGGYTPPSMPTMLPRWGQVLPSYSSNRQFALAAIASSYYGFNQGFVAGRYVALPPYQSSSTYNGYMSGSIGGAGGPAVDAARRDFGEAQKEAEAARGDQPRNQIADETAYEKGNKAILRGGAPLTADQEAALERALAASTEEEITSGEALNYILNGIVALETKGAKGTSAYLAPNLLAEIRFTGSPTAETLNLIRTAGKLHFPTAFDVPSLAKERIALDRDFTSVAVNVLSGKGLDISRLQQLEDAVRNAQERITPVVRDLPFEDAVAVRRFLNHMESAAKYLHGAAAVGVVNPKWATEGTTVEDLARHMAKYKLLFASVRKGDEEAYFALHRGMGAYLFTLRGNLPKKGPGA